MIKSIQKWCFKSVCRYTVGVSNCNSTYQFGRGVLNIWYPFSYLTICEILMSGKKMEERCRNFLIITMHLEPVSCEHGCQGWSIARYLLKNILRGLPPFVGDKNFVLLSVE